MKQGKAAAGRRGLPAAALAYVRSHWRGEQPLMRAFWGNFVAVTALAWLVGPLLREPMLDRPVWLVGLAAVTLVYSMFGGLHASLRTDLFQMLLFLLVLALLLGLVLTGGHFSLERLLFTPFAIGEPGPILLAVALLQIWSYPLHDPVMMDRGFLADRATTRRTCRTSSVTTRGPAAGRGCAPDAACAR